MSDPAHVVILGAGHAGGTAVALLRQYGHAGAHAPVLIVTHKATRDDVAHAMGRFAATAVLVGDPVAIRIEEV